MEPTFPHRPIDRCVLWTGKGRWRVSEPNVPTRRRRRSHEGANGSRPEYKGTNLIKSTPLAKRTYTTYNIHLTLAMNQGGDTDIFGGTRDPYEIGGMLDARATAWASTSSNLRQPPPPGPEPAMSDAGFQYDQLEELPGPKPESKRRSSSRFVTPDLAEPYYVTNRADSRLAFFDESNTQETPEFAQSVIPIDEDYVEVDRWMIEHCAQIYKDPSVPTYVGSQTVRKLTGRLLKNGLVVDLTRTDTVQPGRKPRWVVESYRAGCSDIDRYRAEHINRSTKGHPPPWDFHRSYSIYQPASVKTSVASSAKDPVRTSSGGSSHGSLVSKLKDAVLGNDGKKSQDTSEPKARQEGRGTRGEREEWIEQRTYRDNRGLLRHRVTRTDKGSVRWTTDSTPQSWKSTFTSGTNNCED
jgi:hypothetical protein